MVDFIKAFEDGKKAAIKTENARKEIDAVFDDLNSQLSEMTNGMLKIIRAEVKERNEGLYVHVFPQKFYKAILAINPKIEKSPRKELAKWDFSRVGYPCKISWANEERYCEDKVALEECLADLIKDPVNAEKMLALLEIKKTSEEEEKNKA